MHSTTTVIYTLSLHDALPIYLSQGITLLVWFTASIAPRDIRRRQVARSTGQSKSSSEFRRHGRLARLLPAQRMGRRLRLLRSFFGSLTVCHHPQIAG